MIKDRAVDILAVQEAHLSETHVDQIHTIYGRHMHIFNSIDQENPNTKGVAFALRKKSIKTGQISEKEIVPGRALMIQVPWKNGEQLTIINIYAPNESTENKNFWTTLKNRWIE